MSLLHRALFGLMIIAGGSMPAACLEQERLMVEYEVRPEASEYVAGEDVTLRVRVANHSQAPIQIPDPEMLASMQPVHSLTGPKWQDGIRFTNTRRLEPESSTSESADAPLITIEPGQQWEGTFAPNQFLGEVPDGEYRLASQLVFRNVSAQSQPNAFRVRALRPGSIQLGLGVRPLEAGEGEGAFIDSGALYAFTFKEMRPGIGEAVVNAPIRRATVSANARDVSVPWRNAPFFNELLRWVVWREGRQVKALSSTMTEPLSVSLPADASRLVQPTLKVTGQPVEALALSTDERTLHLVTLGADVGKEASGAVAWSAPLPVKPGPITAALGPEPGNQRHIVFAVNRDGGIDLFHARYTPTGRPESFQNVHIANATVLDGSTIGLFADGSGVATVGAVTCAGEDRRACALVEATFAADGKPGTPRVTALGTVPATPQKTAVLYAEKNGALDWRSAVVQLQGGQILKMEGATLVPLSSQGTPTSPILLAPGKQATYILYIESAGRAHLEAM